MPEPADRRPIYLVGFMGSGKSTVAVELARLTGRRAVDTDELIVSRDGRSIERIIGDEGEPHFRELESAVLREAAAADDLVVATGGGLCLQAANRRFLRRRGRSVWLDLPLERCRIRVGGGAGRPLWPAGDPMEARALFERRAVGYSLSELRVDADGEPAEVARRVLDRLSVPGGG